MDSQTPGNSRDNGGRNLRPKKKLNEAEIDVLIHELAGLDESDLELSDDDEVSDKTYEPLLVPEYDDDEPASPTPPDESVTLLPSSMTAASVLVGKQVMISVQSSLPKKMITLDQSRNRLVT